MGGAATASIMVKQFWKLQYYQPLNISIHDRGRNAFVRVDKKQEGSFKNN